MDKYFIKEKEKALRLEIPAFFKVKPLSLPFNDRHRPCFPPCRRYALSHLSGSNDFSTRCTIFGLRSVTAIFIVSMATESTSYFTIPFNYGKSSALMD
ncbi:hypothetical protein CDAR_579221 [Caerostris darwini]|uniref:Uncharacterized protein n=1 Tax=Caerostris darwini TaxID=1538125 RepID=A0AAV4RUK1_9ARAC|nr:hypothetical protein CDAR_579221 [Caerostris darwini]